MKKYIKEVLTLQDSLRVFLIVGMAVVVLLLSLVMSSLMTFGATHQHDGKHHSVEMMGMKM